MQILDATKNGRITQIHVMVDGVKLEYTRFRGGPWEVYDFPRSYRGVPRFVGHLPAETGEKLDVILIRKGI
jgi:hypothetical protein